MFVDAKEASRTSRLLVLVIGLLVVGGLSFALLPYPYSDYVSLALVLAAGFSWTYLSFQIRLGRTERSARGVDRQLFSRQLITEVAALTGADEHQLMSRRQLLLRALAGSAVLALMKLVFRAVS